jgi:hypothetical protein
MPRITLRILPQSVSRIRGHVDASKVLKILWGKRPTPAVTINPRNYLAFNTLRHFLRSPFVGKNTTFSPQKQASILPETDYCTSLASQRSAVIDRR